MKRTCPGCEQATIPVSELIMSPCACSQCGKRVGVRGFWRAFFVVLITLVAVPSTLAVFMQQGMYAALIWLPFPIGALGYLRARFCPLSVIPAP